MKVWGVRLKPGGELRLPRKAAEGNPLLAVLFARFQEGARLLYGLGEARTSLSEPFWINTRADPLPLPAMSILVPYFIPEQRTPDVPTHLGLQDGIETRDQ